jgi:hypothetical protein
MSTSRNGSLPGLPTNDGNERDHQGQVRPKFTIQKLTAELEKPGSLCNQPGAQARIDFA